MTKMPPIENPFLQAGSHSKLRKLVLASVAGFGILVLACFGAGYAYHAIHGTGEKFLAKIESKLGTKVKIGKREIGINEIVFSDVELIDLGHSKIDEIKFSFGFGSDNGLPKVTSAEVKVASLNLHTEDLKALLTRLQESLQPDTSDASQQNEVQWFLAAPEAIRFHILSLQLRHSDERPLALAKNLKGRLEKNSNLLDLVADSVELEGKDLGPIKASAYGNPSEKSLSFRVAQSSGEQRSGLSIAGNYDGIKHTGSARGRIQGLHVGGMPYLGSFLSADAKDGAIQFQVTINDARGTGLHHFTLTSQGEQLKVLDERLAKTPVGPLTLKSNITGTIDTKKNELKVSNASITLESPAIKVNPIEVKGHGQLTWEKLDLVGLQARVNLPETSCKSLLALDAEHLTPNLVAFDVNGTLQASAQVLFEKKLRKPVQLQIDQWTFGCALNPLNDQVSKERLAKSAPLMSSFQAKSKYKMLFPIDNFVPIQAIPKKIISIFLASEDISFYQHDGIDASSIASALARNASTDKRMLGGSTISMQVAKNLFLNEERTLARKFQELFLTKYLEENLSKQRILELYFNVAEFGPGVYGIGNAAKHLFSKDLPDLSALEVTYLASLLPAPVRRYQYFCQNGLSSNMQELVLQKFALMHKLGRINDDEYESGLHSQITFDHAQRASSPHCPVPQQQAALDTTADDETAVF